MNRRNDETLYVTMYPISMLAPIDKVIYTEAIDEEDDFDGAYTDFNDDEDYENMVDPREYRW